MAHGWALLNHLDAVLGPLLTSHCIPSREVSLLYCAVKKRGEDGCIEDTETREGKVKSYTWTSKWEARTSRASINSLVYAS